MYLAIRDIVSGSNKKTTTLINSRAKSSLSNSSLVSIRATTLFNSDLFIRSGEVSIIGRCFTALASRRFARELQACTNTAHHCTKSVAVQLKFQHLILCNCPFAQNVFARTWFLCKAHILDDAGKTWRQPAQQIVCSTSQRGAVSGHLSQSLRADSVGVRVED